MFYLPLFFLSVFCICVLVCREPRQMIFKCSLSFAYAAAKNAMRNEKKQKKKNKIKYSETFLSRHKQFITDKMIRLKRHAYSAPPGGVNLDWGWGWGSSSRVEVLCDGSHQHV